MNDITIRVVGNPRPGGSKRAFTPKGWTRPVITEDCAKSKEWRTDVKRAASEAMNGRMMLEGALSLCVVFLLPRPKGHFGKRGLRASAPSYPVTKPDATKLLRSTEDALTGIVWRDDAQIIHQIVRKEYAGPGQTIGAIITVSEQEWVQ